MTKQLFVASIVALSCAQVSADKLVTKDIPISAINTKSDLKIRFIDSLTAMRQSKQGKVAGQELEEKRNKLAASIQKEEQEIAKAVNEFKTKSSTLSDTAREKEQQRILKMEREFKNKIEEAELEMKMAMQKVTEQLAKEVEKSVIEIAKKDGLDAVVDTTTGRVIWSAENVNLTPNLVANMDKNHDTALAQSKTVKKPGLTA